MRDENARSRGPFLVVGLGNPGIEYQLTPHNAGFLAIDRLADGRRGGEQSPLPGADRNGAIAGREVVLAKPETFMNLSGLSVRALVEEFDATQQDLLVLYDELALPLGTLRVRSGGSSGGHNGAGRSTARWARRSGQDPDRRRSGWSGNSIARGARITC